MITGFIKFLLRVCFYVALFVGAAWLFLGIPPQETYMRTRTNINKLLGRAGDVSQSSRTMASQMGDEYKTQLQHASDRFHGKDPYERFASRLDDTVKSGGNQVDLRGN